MGGCRVRPPVNKNYMVGKIFDLNSKNPNLAIL
nr:MAG TPA: hypothetical protein [Bacteriophage sp.]